MLFSEILRAFFSNAFKLTWLNYAMLDNALLKVKKFIHIIADYRVKQISVTKQNGVVVITTAQLDSSKPGLMLYAVSNPARGDVSEV